jgi:hypothetical protein
MVQPPRCQPLTPIPLPVRGAVALDSAVAPQHKATVNELIATTVTDARWFPLRFDARADAVQFAWVPAEMQRAVTFLSDLRPGLDQLRTLPCAEVGQVQVDEAPLHFILHSGLDGSTLLARALAQPGIVMTLKEPPILTDVSAYGLWAPPIEAERIRREVTRLLARPFCPGDAIVVKMSSIGNGLVAAMMAERPASRVLCMHAPLATMLASLAAKGLEGRKAGRRLYFGLNNAHLGELGFTETELLEKSDLQLAALAWLAIQQLIGEAARRFGPERVRSISSEQFVDHPREALAAIAAHFGILLDIDRRVAAGVFDRHAKTGQPFNAVMRARAREETLHVHGKEIESIVEWASKVAAANDLACGLPYSLFD